MRYLPLKGLPLKLTATPTNELGSLLRTSLQSNTWPLPQASALLHAIMTWPNNEERRDLFLSACAAKASGAADIGRHSREGTEDSTTATRRVLTLAGMPINLGGFADKVIDELEAEMATARTAWKNVADLMLTLARLHEDERTRGGASIAKAKDLIDASKSGANRQRLEADWSKFRDVAPLATAAATLAATAVSQTRSKNLGDLLYPIFLDPASVLCIASIFQRFGLSLIPHGRREPILSPKSLWHLPTDIEIVPPPFGLGSTQRRLHRDTGEPQGKTRSGFGLNGLTRLPLW
jgi:hypothetical protein